MMKWYKIDAPSEETNRKVIKSLREQHLLVRSKDGDLYACISNHHQVWLSNVCKDFGASFLILEQAPTGIRIPRQEEYLAPCGEKLYDPMLFAQHCRSCLKCKKVKGAVVIAKLEPWKELNLDGVISSLEVVRDQLWERVEGLDNLLTDLKGFRDAKGKLAELNTEADKRVNAVRLLLRDNKL